MKAEKIRRKKDTAVLHLMLLPGVLLVFIYHYIPIGGLVMAFQNYLPARGILGSKWVGLRNFRFLFGMMEFPRALRNTVMIAGCKIILGVVIPVVFALLLNEVRKKWLQRGIQTLIYLPHFISWILLAGILRDLLAPQTGLFNTALTVLGGKSVYFLGDNHYFPWVVIVSEVWKEFGYGTIVYLAALTAIDPTLYEVAYVDGANRRRQLIHITLPGIAPMIVLMTTLSMGNILNGGFDQIFNLYAPVVYETGDILDTLLYRLGLVSMQFSVSTAAGMMKSVVALILITASYRIAYKTTGYRVL
ncbi:MAG: ABC transporter permease subunit [Spirochaetaceae bacterium]|jgi:putative aldouronate transport system permease protein|nr:ABC transporter permease subunit [Spirochaetaceae bacterium]